jgi:hypothetical protein
MSLNQKAISQLQNEWFTFQKNILDNSDFKTLTYTVHNNAPQITANIHNNDEVNFEVIMSFFDVPCRAKQSKCRNIEIYLRSRITYKIISRKEKKIINYNTAVQYCHKQEKKLKCIMGYHYDGDAQSSEGGHPIFHMQFKNNILLDAIREIEKDTYEDILPVENSNERDEIRIPTAQMDLFNTLVSIFSDHLYTTKDENTVSKFNTFLNTINSVLIPCETEKSFLYENGPQTSTCYSNRWYPIKFPEED